MRESIIFSCSSPPPVHRTLWPQPPAPYGRYLKMLLPGILLEKPSPDELSADSFECSISTHPKGKLFPGGCSLALFKMKALGNKFHDTVCTSLVSQKARHLEVLKQRINLIFSFNSSPSGLILHFPQPEYNIN